MRLRDVLLLLAGTLLLHASSASALPINYLDLEIRADARAEVRDSLVPPLVAPVVSDPAETVGTVVGIRNAIVVLVDPPNFRDGSASVVSSGSHLNLPQSLDILFEIQTQGDVESGLMGVTNGFGAGRIEFSFGPSLEAGPGDTIGVALGNTLAGFSGLPSGIVAMATVTLINQTQGVTLYDSDVDGFPPSVVLGGVEISDVLILEYEIKVDGEFLAPVDILTSLGLSIEGIPIPEPTTGLLLAVGAVALVGSRRSGTHS